MSYPCTRCGLCCQQIQHVPELKGFHNGDGICFYFKTDVGCTVYQERPLVCRIDEGYQQLFEKQLSLRDYYLKNAEACNYMQLQANFPSHYRVKLIMDKNQLLQFLPTDEQNVNRLLYLKNNATKPRIAVFGKYNHGKSSLLNALVGEAIFKAADKRETIENKELEQDHVIWIDTPGLDADVHKKDDKLAIKSAFEMADYLFLVHQVQAGELDKYEIQIFQQLARQDKNYSKKMFLVLTQVDQKAADEVTIVEEKIRQQLLGSLDLRDLQIISVSAHRYSRGILEGKEIFCEKSGMQALFDLTETLVSEVDELRKKEMKRLKSKLLLDFSAQKQALNTELKGLHFQQNNELSKLKRDVKKLTAALA